LPETHCPVAAQKPHPLTAVQASQVPFEAHGSTGVLQSATFQLQSAQLPLVGPAAVPDMQSPEVEQKPQPSTVVQSSHAACVAQGSDGAGHALLNHCQLAQLPADGPDDEPETHWSFESQKPQPAMAVQSAQLAAPMQGSAAEVQTPFEQLSPE